VGKCSRRSAWRVSSEQSGFPVAFGLLDVVRDAQGLQVSNVVGPSFATGSM